MFGSLSFASAAHPSFSITPDSGSIGDVVTVSGTGFAKYSQITIEAFKFETTTDKLGGFDDKVTIPSDLGLTAGTYDITAKDASGNEANARFTILPSITLTPALGASGSVVTVTGNGFSSDPVGDKLCAAFNGKDLKLEHLENGEVRGTFSATFTVPDIKPGIYPVTVTCQADPTIQASADFAVSALVATPENPFGALLAVFACAAAVVVFMKKCRK
jgi:hypothetical protein